MDTVSALTLQEKQHIAVMAAIAKELVDTPLLLKGGTALLLCYGLDRFSEDLDFDSFKILNLEAKIKSAIKYPIKMQSLDVLKATETVTRYRLIYTSNEGENRLKIEVSHRLQEIGRFRIIQGIKVYEIAAIIEQKLQALQGRTAARDLYDIGFLVTNYQQEFSKINWLKLAYLMSDLNAMEKRFLSAFADDDILNDKNVSDIVLSINEAILSRKLS